MRNPVPLLKQRFPAYAGITSRFLLEFIPAKAGAGMTSTWDCFVAPLLAMTLCEASNFRSTNFRRMKDRSGN